MHSYEFSTPETPPAAPNADQDHHTIRDYEWLLTRYTSPRWSLESIEFEYNDHASVRCSVLSASLRHETGSHVQILPFDPWEHHPGTTIYRRHRVRLRDTARDEDAYLTFDRDITDVDTHLDIPDGPLPDALSGPETPLVPFPTLEAAITVHSQAQVHHTDSQVTNLDTQHGRGYNIKPTDHAALAAIAGTRRVAREVQQQTGLDAFTTHPAETP